MQEHFITGSSLVWDHERKLRDIVNYKVVCCP